MTDKTRCKICGRPEHAGICEGPTQLDSAPDAQIRCGGTPGKPTCECDRGERPVVNCWSCKPCPGCPDCRPCKQCGGEGKASFQGGSTLKFPCDRCQGSGVEPASEQTICETCGSKYPEADCADGDYVERNIIPDSLLCPDEFHQPRAASNPETISIDDNIYRKGEYAFWKDRNCIIRVVDTPDQGLVEKFYRGVHCVEPTGMFQGILKVYVEELRPFYPPQFPWWELAKLGFIGGTAPAPN